MIEVDRAGAQARPRVHLPAIGVIAEEWRFVALVTLAMLIITSIPYLFASVRAPADKVFTGIIYDVPDTGQYFAWMRASQQGILISDTLTPEPNAPAFFNLVFWMLGRISLYSGISFAGVWQLFRLVSGVLFLSAAYYFCSIFFEERAWRRTAFLLIALGSGFGAFVLALGKLGVRVDVGAQYVAEGNTLYSMMAFPLLTFAAGLITLVLAWAYRAYESRAARYAFASGITALVLGWSHGYDLIMIYSVLAAFTLMVLARDGWAWDWLRSAAIIVALSVAPALYSVYLTNANPVWRAVLAQFVNAGVFSPNPLNLLFLMGIPLLLALITFDGFLPLRTRPPGELFIKTWFIVNFFVIYLPVDYQIHFINAWQVPMALLATRGFFRHVLPRVQNMRFRACFAPRAGAATILPILLILVVLPTNLYLVGWRVNDMRRANPPSFLPRAQVAALDWLRENTSPDAVVLSSLEVGQFIPGLAGNRAMLAHWSGTLDYYGKQRLVNEFYNAATGDEQRRAIIARYNIQYIVWSDSEKQLGSWNPEGAPYVQRVWSESSAALYRVRSE